MSQHGINSTLCYLEKDGCYLMLHRIKKENDQNKDKWIGVGGKFEPFESPENCVQREVREETGLTLQSMKYRGIVTFVSESLQITEYMHLFTSSNFSGSLAECDEGELVWVPIADVPHLPIWEGDRIFLTLLHQNEPFFSLKLVYSGNDLIGAWMNGKELSHEKNECNAM